MQLLGGADCFSPHVPMALQVEFTSRCNLRCRMCPLTTKASSSSAAPGPMFDAVFDEVLAVARRCRWVIVAGYGEALTNPQCLPMLRALDAEGIDMSIATNGLALTPAVARSLSEIRHLSMINVSIDSPDPDVYRAVRRGNVHRALDGLRNLMAEIDRPERVMVSSIAMLETLESLVDFPPLLAEIGVRRYAVQAIVDYNDYCVGQRLLDHPEMAALFDAIEASCADARHSPGPFRSRPFRRRPRRPGRRAAALLRLRRLGRGSHAPVSRAVGDTVRRQERRGVRVLQRRLGERAAARPDRRPDVRRDLDRRRVPAVPNGHRRRPNDARHLPPLHDRAARHPSVQDVGRHPDLRERDASGQTAHHGHGRRSQHRLEHVDAGRLVRVGVARPRDSPSRLASSDWLSGNRAATFAETEVPPGEARDIRVPAQPSARHDDTGIRGGRRRRLLVSRHPFRRDRARPAARCSSPRAQDHRLLPASVSRLACGRRTTVSTRGHRPHGLALATELCDPPHRSTDFQQRPRLRSW